MNNLTTQTKNIEYYKNIKEKYGKIYNDLSAARQYYINGFIKMLKKYLKEGDKICDIGCGSGIITEVIQKKVSYNIVGLELISRYLEEAKSLGRNFVIVKADALNMPFNSNEFKAVIYFGTAHHLPNLPQAFKEAYRVLEPGGYCFLSEPNAYSARKAIRMVFRPKLLLGYLRIFKEKNLEKRDKKILGKREQRSLVPKVVINSLKQANFNVISYKTTTDRFMRGILKEIKLKFLLKNKLIQRIVFNLDNHFLNHIPVVNKFGPKMVIVAKKE